MPARTTSRKPLPASKDTQTFGLMIKIALTSFIFLLSTLASFGQNQIIGKWLSDDKEGETEIYEQQGKYFGKIS